MIPTYLISDFKKQGYRVSEAAQILGVSTKTIRNYDSQGILKAERTVGNQRIITRDELIRFLSRNGLITDDVKTARRDVIYARIKSQKDIDDLDRQVLFLVENASDIQNPLILKDIGSGSGREKLQQLLTMIGKGEIRNVYITDEGCLTECGFGYIKIIANACGTDIITIERNK